MTILNPTEVKVSFKGKAVTYPISKEITDPPIIAEQPGRQETIIIDRSSGRVDVVARNGNVRKSFIPTIENPKFTRNDSLLAAFIVGDTDFKAEFSREKKNES